MKESKKIYIVDSANLSVLKISAAIERGGLLHKSGMSRLGHPAWVAIGNKRNPDMMSDLLCLSLTL